MAIPKKVLEESKKQEDARAAAALDKQYAESAVHDKKAAESA